MDGGPSKKARYAEPPGADVKLGRIERLIVENFKSYEGLHEIGPFDKFTCIIGPNGAGKSNIMDAISFCLGIKAKHLRGDKLRDLVYRKEEETAASNTRRASAIIEFRTASGGLLLFGRMINMRGEGSYRYGPPDAVRNVNYDEFLKHLANQGLFVKARNFLVFQGDVMELARRQGQELTGMLETISGSDQLKETYDRLARELDIAEERARLHFQHRREVEGMMSVLEMQQREYERYNELLQERDNINLERHLFKLYCSENDMMLERDSIEEYKEVLATADRQLRLKRKEADELVAEKAKLEKEVEDANAAHGALSTNLNQLKPELSNCQKQAAQLARKHKECEEQIQVEEARQKGNEKAWERARKDRIVAEGHLTALQKTAIEPEVQMTPAQHREFERLVAQTDALNLQTRQQLREMEERLASCNRDLRADRRDLADLEQKQLRTSTHLEELTSERKSLEKGLKGDGTTAQAKRRRADDLGDEVKKFNSFRDSLAEEQRTLRYQLDLANSRKERLEQIEARQRLADELRDAFPDAVLGRLSEVLLPTQKRFDLPLQMSMGIMAEAFIVVSAEAGRRCVQYLKEKRIGQETFLPLDRMVAPKVGPLHLLTSGKKARRLATVCAEANEKFLERHPHWAAEGRPMIEKACNFLLSGTIIVDDLSEAKTTAYKDAKTQGLRPRVVTLQGEVIAPNGNMSVQSASAMAPVEFGGADQLHEIRTNEKKLLQVEQDLTILAEELKRKETEHKEAIAQAEEAEGGRKTLHAKLKAVSEAEAAEKAALTSQRSRAVELKLRLTRVSDMIAKLEDEKEGLEEELLKVGRKAFAKLSAELGVYDVREVMQREERERRKLRQEMEECEDHIRKLRNDELAAEQRCKASSKLDSLRRAQDQYQKDIEAAADREKVLEAKETELIDQCEAASDKVRQAALEKDRKEQDLKDLRSDLHRAAIQAEDARRKMRRQQDRLRVLLVYKCTVLREIHDLRLVVPLHMDDREPLERVLRRDLDLEEVPFADLEVACDAIKIDFTALPEEQQVIAGRTRIFETRTIEAEYEARITVIDKELSGLRPNIHAGEECETEGKRLKEIQGKADHASKESQRLAREFEAVKTERMTRFMRCFKHVEEHLHPFYRELTSYDGNEGGAAYLDLDDPEEPYNGGVTFTACPPGKRFFPMELLSGGERSMASMALLFAMHSFKPPPFMILDEVDAPFDKKNTGSLVDYLKKLHFQTLVISLKDTFFSHSDSIIGIYKDKVAQTSGTLTLPLKVLGQERPPPETEVPLAEGENVD